MENHRTFCSARQKWQPLGLSLFAHLVLAMLLILGWFSVPRNVALEKLRPATIVLALDSLTPKTEYLTEPGVLEFKDHGSATGYENILPVDGESPPAVATAGATSVRDRYEGAGAAAGTNSFENMDARRMTTDPASKGVPTEFELSDEDLKLIEADQKLISSRQPVGDPASLSVFGSGNITGRSFVFALDRSKSMGSSGLGVIEASRIELAAAISQLQPHHQFQIVGYHDRTVSMSTRQMLPANPMNQELVGPFVGGLVAYGRTQHDNGLIAALAFRPDAIVLLTDGGYPELNAGQLDLIRRIAAGKTTIHCLHFGRGPRQPLPNFMAKLAEQNHGNYRYIDVNQWNKAPK